MRCAAALATVVLLIVHAARAQSGQKLVLDPEMVTDLFSLSAMNQPATYLTDEQGEALSIDVVVACGVQCISADGA
jgi:hypothetical protein